ncbi:MAG: hypothetical protein BHV69_01255 [Bacteroidales bacterium 52_46]|nr:MAG: hypothetical protein BHV69_01255 [Bacteroidales bacterium 52_46]
MPDTIKKRIGICLCIIFGISLITCLLQKISSFTYINYLYLLSDIIYIGPILFIAFNKQSGSNIWSKTGGGLYVALLLMFASEQVAILEKGTPLIEFGFLGWAIISSATSLFLLMFYWGTRIWLPIKIVITTNVIPNIVNIIAYSKVIHVVDSDYHTRAEAVESYESTVDIISILTIIIYAVSLILTIVWLLESSKKVSAAKVNQQAIKEPNQASKPEFINKIPHK